MIYLVLTAWIILQMLVALLVCIFVMVIYKFVAERLQIYYYRWKNKRSLRRREKNYEELLQQLKRRELHERIEKQKRELHEMEKRRYPLFYWRELE